MKGKDFWFKLSGLLKNWVVPENIHTDPMEGHWKFRGERGSQQPKVIMESVKLNWTFHGGGRAQTKTPSMGDVCIFLV